MKLHWLASLTLFVASASALTTNISPDRRSTPDVDKELVERQATACRAGLILYAGRCIYPTRCPSGAFGNHQTQRCQTCISKFPNAATCSFTSATSCKVPFFLRLGRCVEVCPDNTFVLPGTRTCLGCTARFSFSLTCTADEALTCREPRVLLNGQCVTAASCIDGQFRDTATNTCKPCNDSNALTCSSASVSLTCKNNFVVDNGVCKATSCPDGQYLSGGACVNCPGSNVATCNSQTTLTCKSGFSLVGGSCVATANCASNQYRAAATNTCVDCAELSTGTLTCTETGGAQTCAPGLIIEDKRCTCTSAQGLDTTVDPPACFACVTRFGTGTLTCSQTTALTCAPTLTIINNNCACAPTLYKDTAVSPPVCRDCSVYGKYTTACSASAPTACTFPTYVRDNKCACDANQYIKDSVPATNPPVCTACTTIDALSATCNDNAQVLTCQANTYFVVRDPSVDVAPIGTAKCTIGEAYSSTKTVNFGDNAGGVNYGVSYNPPAGVVVGSQADCVAASAGQFAFEYEDGVINQAGKYCYTAATTGNVAITGPISTSTNIAASQPLQFIVLTSGQILINTWRMFLKGVPCTSATYVNLATTAVRYNDDTTSAAFQGSIASVCTDVILAGKKCFLPPGSPSNPPAPAVALLDCPTP